MILITGIPNAGKTTYSMQYNNVIHFDEVRGTYRKMHSRINKMVADSDGKICIEGVYGKAWERIALLQAVKNKHIKNTCIWLNTPEEICEQREHNFRKRSKYIVRWAAEQYEPPTLEEGWDEIIIIRGENDVTSISN